MLVNADAKGLEVVAAAYLSQDPVLMKEIWSGSDMHSDNMKVFGIPSRLIAKIFVFRLIYGGSAYSYSVDPDFAEVGFKQKKWQQVIDKFYEKYDGLKQWHTKIVQEAILTGRVSIPTGRVFEYQPFQAPNGEIKWPRTTILNYPVQGFGADLMMLARLSFASRLARLNLRSVLISTVHDSIVVDCPDDEYKIVCKLFHEVFRDIPANFKKMFGIEFNLPMKCEVLVGKNLREMVEYKDE